MRLNNDIMKMLEHFILDDKLVPDMKLMKTVAKSITEALTKLPQPNYATAVLTRLMIILWSRKYNTNSKTIFESVCGEGTMTLMQDRKSVV